MNSDHAKLAAMTDISPTEQEIIDSIETMEQRKQASEAFARYQGLVQKMKNPKLKHDILDVLEYEHIRDKQSEYNKVTMEKVRAQTAAAKAEEDAKKTQE